MNRSTFSRALIVLGVAVPLTAFAGQSSAPSGGTTPSTPPAAQAPSQHNSKSTKSSMPKVDLNSATVEQLTSLPGINQTTADKIVAARPFKSSKQLYESKIVTKSEYKAIESRVTVKTPKSASSKQPK